MGNHFHLLVKMFPEYKFTDEDIKKRYVGFYGDDLVFAYGQVPSLREKLSNLSEFVREIKVGFTRYYNKRNNLTINAITDGAIFGETGLKVLLLKKEKH